MLLKWRRYENRRCLTWTMKSHFREVVIKPPITRRTRDRGNRTLSSTFRLENSQASHAFLAYLHQPSACDLIFEVEISHVASRLSSLTMLTGFQNLRRSLAAGHRAHAGGLHSCILRSKPSVATTWSRGTTSLKVALANASADWGTDVV